MTQVTVTEPTEGGVLIDVDYKTASALCRVLGKVNHGDSLKTGLNDIYSELEKHFGNDSKARGEWKRATINPSRPQIYIQREK